MQKILHRVNRQDGLAKIDRAWGAEIDLRSRPVGGQAELYLHHDAGAEGELFSTWLAAYKAAGCSGPLILNTKEDGLEALILAQVQQHGIASYFFLDTALPTLINWTMRRGCADFAVRLSAYEPVAAVLPFAGKARWLWVDCFDGVPVPIEWLKELHGRFKICLVSPELQGQDVALVAKFKEHRLLADAVCSKQPALWT